jgi:hypothetical protein
MKRNEHEEFKTLLEKWSNTELTKSELQDLEKSVKKLLGVVKMNLMLSMKTTV